MHCLAASVAALCVLSPGAPAPARPVDPPAVREPLGDDALGEAEVPAGPGRGAELIGTTRPLCRTLPTTHRNALDPVLEHLGDGTFGALWRQGSGNRYALAYGRLDAGGAILDGPVTVTPYAEHVVGQALAWNGARVAITWVQHLGNTKGLFFRLLESTGRPVSAPLRIDAADDPDGNALSDLAARNFKVPRSLVWDGQTWGVSWHEFPPEPTGFMEVRFSRVSADGSSRTPPVTASDSADDVWNPRLVFDGADYGLFWVDERSDPTLQIRFRRMGIDGTPAGPSVAVLEAETIVGFYDVTWSGTEYGLSWIDSRDGDQAAWFVRVSSDGSPLSTESRLSEGPHVFAGNPTLRWLGDRWALVVDYWAFGTGTVDTTTVEIALSFADVTGAKLGDDVVVSAPADDFVSDSPGLAWGDGTLLAAWREGAGPESSEIQAQPLDADGAPAGAVRAVTAGHTPGFGVIGATTVVPIASGYVLALVDEQQGHDGGEPILQLLAADGWPLTGPIRVPDTAGSWGYNVAAAASSEVVVVLWDDLSTGSKVWLSLFHHSGLKLGADLLLSDTARYSGLAVAWTGSAFLAAWRDHRDGSYEIYTAAVDADGNVLAAANRISSDPAQSRDPALAGDGTSRVVVWRDRRGQADEIWAAALDPLGRRVGAEVSVTADDGLVSNQPALAYDGLLFGLAWRERTDPPQVHFVRLANGLPLGLPVQLSERAGFQPSVAWGADHWGVAYNGSGGPYYVEVDSSGTPLAAERRLVAAPAATRTASLAFDGERFVLALTHGVEGSEEAYLTSLPCLLDVTPPTCPTGLAHSVDGADVELIWTPGSDADFAVLWQYLSRDGRRLAALDPLASSFVDPFVPDGTYTYEVVTVNEALRHATGCPSVLVTLANGIFADGFESGDTSAWSEAIP